MLKTMLSIRIEPQWRAHSPQLAAGSVQCIRQDLETSSEKYIWYE